MGLKTFNKTGNIDSLIADLQENYEFQKITDDGKMYISEKVYLAKSGTDLYCYRESSSTKIMYVQSDNYQYCVAVTDTGIAFGHSVNTMYTFIGKITTSDGMTSNGIICEDNSYGGRFSIMTDNTTNVSSFTPPRSSTTTNGYQLQLVPVMAIYGDEIFDDICWVLYANQTASNWVDTPVILNGNYYYVGKYIAIRYNK